MFSVFYQQDLTKALFIRCLFMQRVLQVPCNGRPSLLSRLAKKAGSVGNTRLLPHANMPLVPMNCFLCRVDYALEENVLTEQMWISGYGYIYHFLLMLPFNIFSQCDANVPEIVPQEYPGTSTQLPKPEDLEPFQHPATLSTQRYILGDRFHSG